MGKDFDFRKPVYNNIKPAVKPEPKPVVIENKQPLPSNIQPKPKKSKKKIFWFLLILILISVGVFFAYRYLQEQEEIKIISSNPNTETEKIISSPLVVDMEAISIYDRGIGESLAKNAVQTLVNSGFAPKYFETNNFNFKQSFIFYHASKSQEATKIVQLLANHNLIGKESPLPGISIYLGTN